MRTSNTLRGPAHALFIRGHLGPLLCSEDPYLSPEYVEKHAIKCRRIDFFTGRPLGYGTGELFTRLYSWDAIDRAIEANKPWECHRTGSNIYSLDYWDPGLNNWWHAMNIIDVISAYLSCHYLGAVGPDAGVLHHTDWVASCLPDHWRLSIHETFAQWSATRVIRRENPGQPHLTCCLVDKFPLRDDCPSFHRRDADHTYAERMRSLDKGHEHHTRIPVNLISAAGKQVRVLVGVVDSARGTIEVRRSPIINLSEGEQASWKEWITLLCWVAGEPLGKTH